VQETRKYTMARPSPWAPKVAALIDARNLSGALAQIKVAPSVRDLQALQKWVFNHPQHRVDKVLGQAIADQVLALSHPSLHRSP